MAHTGWSELLPKPYFVDASPELRDLFADLTVEGITIAAPGFYAPQGRWVRLQPADSDLNAKIESFRYYGRRITNFEMEGVRAGRPRGLDGSPCGHVVHHYCTAGIA